jgi:hypothetical protein
MFDIEQILPDILGLLVETGIFYFPINFDGITSFMPALDTRLDRLVEDIYHDSMDARAGNPEIKGHSQSGRLLLSELARLGHGILEAGASDWIVYPRNSLYRDADQYFLSQMLRFVQGEISKSNVIDKKEAMSWIRSREKQLENGVLMFMAHQIDVLGQVVR